MSLYFKMGAIRDEAKALQLGPTVYGRVIAKHDFPKQGEVEVIASFREKGREWAARASMPSQAASRYRVGQHVAIAHPSDHPEQAVLPTDLPVKTREVPLPWMWATMTVQIALTSLITVNASILSRQKSHLRDDQAVPARVVQRTSGPLPRIVVRSEDGTETAFRTLPFLHRDLVPDAPATLLLPAKGKPVVAESLWGVTLEMPVATASPQPGVPT